MGPDPIYYQGQINPFLPMAGMTTAGPPPALAPDVHPSYVEWPDPGFVQPRAQTSPAGPAQGQRRDRGSHRGSQQTSGPETRSPYEHRDNRRGQKERTRPQQESVQSLTQRNSDYGREPRLDSQDVKPNEPYFYGSDGEPRPGQLPSDGGKTKRIDRWHDSESFADARMRAQIEADARGSKGNRDINQDEDDSGPPGPRSLGRIQDWLDSESFVGARMKASGKARQSRNKLKRVQESTESLDVGSACAKKSHDNRGRELNEVEVMEPQRKPQAMFDAPGKKACDRRDRDKLWLRSLKTLRGQTEWSI